MHRCHASAVLEGGLIIGWRREVGEHLFARRAEIESLLLLLWNGEAVGVVIVGDGGVALIDGSAEDGVLVFDEAGDERGGDVQGWREDDADCDGLADNRQFESESSTYHYERSSC